MGQGKVRDEGRCGRGEGVGEGKVWDKGRCRTGAAATTRGWLCSRGEEIVHQPLSPAGLSPAALWGRGDAEGLTRGCCHAGVWARALGRLAGVHVPLVAMHHAYVVTERIEGIQVSPARLQLGSSAPGDRAGQAERPLPLPGTPRPLGHPPPHSCKVRLCSRGSAHPQPGCQTTLSTVRFNI